MPCDCFGAQPTAASQRNVEMYIVLRIFWGMGVFSLIATDILCVIDFGACGNISTLRQLVATLLLFTTARKQPLFTESDLAELLKPLSGS